MGRLLDGGEGEKGAGRVDLEVCEAVLGGRLFVCWLLVEGLG
ncbi:hypothetical protein [Bartonella henselae]|nr:hypothetical protein [Bartonella henselae]MDM9997267.1 hypothetical protein [Bartonella henselae]